MTKLYAACAPDHNVLRQERKFFTICTANFSTAQNFLAQNLYQLDPNLLPLIRNIFTLLTPFIIITGLLTPTSQ